VPPLDRPSFVDELLRVANQCVLLMAPFHDENTERAERALRGYLAANERTHRQLEEHFEQGLPAITDQRELLAERGLAAIEFADGYLPNWLAMIMIHLTPGTSLDFLAELDRFYNRHFSPDDRREPAYRRAFVIAKQGREELLAAIEPTFDSGPAATFPRPDFAADLASLLRQTHSDGRARFDCLEAENARLRGVIEGYEQGRFIRFMRLLHDWRDGLLRSTGGR
jgi:hypothetical protein